MANQLEYLHHLQRLQHLQGRRQLRRERVFQDRQNPFEYYTNEEFHHRFRFTKENTIFIIDIIADDIRFNTNRNKALPPYLQVLTALSFYGSGGFHVSVGDRINIHRSTVCRTVKRVSIALAQRRADFIKMPTTRNAVRETYEAFHDMHQFPNIIGLIDCTHIRISNPGGEGAARFVNRKGYHSINTQVICDAKPSITNIVARWPGSVHDARIFDECQIKERFEEGVIGGYLLGDPGYPCLPYLMTPLQNPTTQAERNYNRAQRCTRSLVERLFGVWKRRFACLHYTLRLRLETSFAVIIATAILHNIAVARGDAEFQGYNDEEPPVDPVNAQNGQGFRARARLIAEHF